MYNYTNLTFTELVDKIGNSRFWDLPRMLKEILTRLIPQAPTYKVYTALLTQTGTDAPVATVLENTIGEFITSRNSAGSYYITFTEDLTLDKTNGFSGNGKFSIGEPSPIIHIYRVNNNTLGIELDTPSDDVLSGFPIEIRVYN